MTVMNNIQDNKDDGLNYKQSFICTYTKSRLKCILLNELQPHALKQPKIINQNTFFLISLILISNFTLFVYMLI